MDLCARAKFQAAKTANQRIVVQILDQNMAA
jgi:hypothetical protein